jgi:GH24 family phage-related lysozyme (muramidase)
MDLTTIKSWIEHWEGRRNQTYDDKTGKAMTPGCVAIGHPTVGVGFNLDATGAQAAIQALGLDYNQVRSGQQLLTDEQIDALLEQTVNQAIQGARQVVPSFDSLPDDKQVVIVDMVFNLGVRGFSQFLHTIQAVNNQDWARAAQQMQQSAWFRQVGARASADVNLMAGRITATQFA